MITDKNTMLIFKIQKDMEGINILGLNGFINNKEFNEIMEELEDDLLIILDKLEKILNKWKIIRG